MEGALATSPSRVHLAGCRPWTGERDKRVRLAAQPPRGRTWGPPGKKRGGEATSEVWGAFVIGPREGGMQAVHSYMGGGLSLSPLRLSWVWRGSVRGRGVRVSGWHQDNCPTHYRLCSSVRRSRAGRRTEIHHSRFCLRFMSYCCLLHQWRSAQVGFFVC